MLSKPVLLDMPEIPMNMIMEHFDLKQILILRKVCRGIRNFIDERKYEGHIKQIEVFVEHDLIKLRLNRKSELRQEQLSDYRLLEYEKKENGCRVRFDRYARIDFQNMDFIQAFLNDFDILLKFQKPVMDFFGIFYKDRTFRKIGNEMNLPIAIEFSNRFETIFKSRTNLIKIEHIAIKTIGQEEIMKILPYIEPDTFDFLVVTSSGDREDEDITIEINEVVELPQWKKLKRLLMRTEVYIAPLETFCHFSVAHISTNIKTPRDLMVIKELLIASPVFEQFHLENIDFDDDEDLLKMLYDLFGEPCLDNVEIEDEDLPIDPLNIPKNPKWYFKSPFSEICVICAHYACPIFQFFLLGKAYVPINAVIQD